MKEKKPASFDITHTVLSVLFIGLLIASCFWIVNPFLMPLVWASLIVVASWPLLEKLEALLKGRRGLAVALMTVAILLIIIVPITLAILTIVNNAHTISAQVVSLESIRLSEPPDWLKRIPFAGEHIVERWRSFAALSPEERAAMVTPYAQKALQWFAAKAGSIGMTIFHFLLTAIIAAILFANGESVRDGILSFARRLAGRQGEEVSILAAKAVRGVFLGVVVTALVQAALGGIGLFIAGVPAAGLLTAVMVMLCLAQLGPFLVLIPSIVWIYWSGSPLMGTVLVVFSVLAGTIDNFLRPFLIRKGADLPLLLIFAGVIGGLVAFGIIGLFLGPVVLAVAYTLLAAWVSGDALKDEEGSGAE